jgi:hypothetical protein
MRGTKEIYEVMSMFEKVARNLFYGHKVERYLRDEKVPSDQFYCDGYVNAIFLAFLSGYQYHKSVSNDA